MTKTHGLELFEPKKHHSITALQCFDRCPFKYFLEKGCKMSMGNSHTAMDFGTALHAAMPFSYPDSVDEIRACTDRGMKEFRENWPAECEAEGDVKRNLGRARTILKRFCSTHVKGRRMYDPVAPPPNVPKMKGRSKNEISFAIDLGLDRPIVGWIDLLGRHCHTELLFAIDYKSCYEMSSRFENSLFLLPQGMLYALVAKYITGTPDLVEGYGIEGILVAKCKVENLISFHELQDFQYEWFMEWLTRTADAVAACEKSKHWPRRMTGCNPYATFYQPGWTCNFEPLCRTRDWTKMLQVMHRMDDSDFAIDFDKALYVETKDAKT